METPSLDKIENALIRKCELFGFFIDFLERYYSHTTVILDQLSHVERKEFLIKFSADFSSHDESYPALTLLLDVGAFNTHLPMRFANFVESSTIRSARKEIESVLIQLVTTHQNQLFAKRLKRHNDLVNQLRSYIGLIMQLLSPGFRGMEDDEILNKLEPDNEEGLREALRTIDWLVSFAEDTELETRNWRRILHEYLQLIEPNAIAETSTTEWVGDKSDLAELVWAAFKSERIRDKETGKSITQIKLVEAFEKLFDTNLDVTGLMKARCDSTKANDGKTFLTSLSKLVLERMENKKKR